MKFKFFVKTSRVNYVFLELKSKCQIVEQDDEWTTIEITLDNDLDALSLFHAGLRAGWDETINQLKIQ